MTSETSPALDAGALERLLDGDLAQLVRRQAAECPVEGADRRARGADDDDVVLHGNLLSVRLAAVRHPAGILDSLAGGCQ